MRIRHFLVVLVVFVALGSLSAQENEPLQNVGEQQLEQVSNLYAEPEATLEPLDTDALTVLADELRLGSPERVGGAWAFPLYLDKPGTQEYLTLAEAGEKGLLEVNELESAEVNAVELVWETKRPLFILAGQMIRGAKQDRVFARDVLVNGQGRGQLPVYCVEAGRWTSGQTAFTPAKMVVSNEVRGAVNLQADQGTVWSKVSEVQESVGQYSETSAYGVVLEDSEVSGILGELGDIFNGFAEDGACGVLLFGGGYVLGLDVFDNAALFGELSGELGVAYSTQVAVLDEEPGHPEPGKLVKEFLGDLGGLATFAYPGEPFGEGVFVVVNDGRLSGGFLKTDDGVVHLMLTQSAPE
ncbi:MAG: hypothetical protein NTW26_03495 [bacterium]|nr:hypothetical protein [bacterium]